MRDYVKPSLKHSPSLIALHIGTNSLRSKNDAKYIAGEIIDLALDIKTDDNEVLISGIVPRKDNLNEKGIEVNKILKIKCIEYGLGFCGNANMNFGHLNQSGLHLNGRGSWQLASNLVDHINL